MLTVLFFARLKDQLGTASVSLDIAAGTSISQLKAQLIAQHPEWDAALNNANIICAVNHDVVNANYELTGNEEVAFFPPVTGG